MLTVQASKGAWGNLSKKKWQGSVSGYNLGTQMLTAQISLISRAVDHEESSGIKVQPEAGWLAMTLAWEMRL